jgi:hypothetical protein
MIIFYLGNITPNFHSPATSNTASPLCTTPPIVSEREADVSINKGTLFTKENAVVSFDEFNALVKSSNPEVLEKTTSETDFPALLKKSLEVITLVSGTLIKNKDYVGLIENVFSLLFPCLTAKPELINLLYSYPGIDKAFAHVLISSRHESLRKAFSFTINSICANFLDKVYLVGKSMTSDMKRY